MKNGLKTMLKVDSRRMFRTSRFYIFLVIALVMPVLILVMTASLGGTAVTDPTTGAETQVEAFTSAWQIIAADTSSGSAMSMDMTAMCNINLVYFLSGVLMCIFVSEDFSSGYSKNLFTVRAKKGSYVASKTIIGFICGALLLIAFFTGSVAGGKMAGLSFDLGALNTLNVIMCMLAKIFLMSVFIAIFLLCSVVGKQRAWLSICLSLFGGMLLFMMIPMMTPLNSGAGNVGMCLAGGAIFAAGIGIISKVVLNRSSLV